MITKNLIIAEKRKSSEQVRLKGCVIVTEVYWTMRVVLQKKTTNHVTHRKQIQTGHNQALLQNIHVLEISSEIRK